MVAYLPNAENRDVIDGHAVIERERASYSVVGDRPVKTSTVEVVMLDNGEVWYQCAHADAPSCNVYADNARSVASHQRTHGPKITARRLAREVEAMRAARATSTERRQRGSGAAAEVRRAKRDEVAQASVGEVLRREAAKLEGVASWLKACAAQSDYEARKLQNLAEAVPPAELDELRRKAQEFDELKKLLGRL